MVVVGGRLMLSGLYCESEISLSVPPCPLLDAPFLLRHLFFFFPRRLYCFCVSPFHSVSQPGSPVGRGVKKLDYIIRTFLLVH